MQYGTLLCFASSSVSIQPYMRFLFVSASVCVRLPSDSTSRWTPLSFANSSYCKACSGLSPPSYHPCRAHKENAGPPNNGGSAFFVPSKQRSQNVLDSIGYPFNLHQVGRAAFFYRCSGCDDDRFTRLRKSRFFRHGGCFAQHVIHIFGLLDDERLDPPDKRQPADCMLYEPRTGKKPRRKPFVQTG